MSHFVTCGGLTLVMSCVTQLKSDTMTKTIRDNKLSVIFHKTRYDRLENYKFPRRLAQTRVRTVALTTRMRMHELDRKSTLTLRQSATS